MAATVLVAALAASAPDIPGLVCRTPVVDTGSLANDSVDPTWTLVQAHVHQRHLDRWVYPHDLIENVCWPGQLNSTASPMPDQCAGDLSSVWFPFSHTPDPYAAPAPGFCAAKQLTLQGRDHARALGRAYAAHFASALPNGTCAEGSVGLECVADQKGQMTTQEVYHGMCGRLPDTKEFPTTKVVNIGLVLPGLPFWLQQDVCGGDVLSGLNAEAQDAKLRSDYWQKDVRNTAMRVGAASGHPLPEEERWAELLDNVEDCIVSHACHGLDDTPPGFRDASNLLTSTDVLETASRAYAYTHFRGANATKYRDYAALHYGYYYRVLLDRMQGRIDGRDAKGVYIQVTSDGVVTPQLQTLGLTETARHRPVWGSGIVYELYRRGDDHAVRVLFNGRTQRVCEASPSGLEHSALCMWSDFVAKLEKVIPTRDECPKFYNAYKA